MFWPASRWTACLQNLFPGSEYLQPLICFKLNIFPRTSLKDYLLPGFYSPLLDFGFALGPRCNPVCSLHQHDSIPNPNNLSFFHV